ncbi:MAG: M13 family metallopeptidase [Clostridia bacterium]
MKSNKRYHCMRTILCLALLCSLLCSSFAFAAEATPEAPIEYITVEEAISELVLDIGRNDLHDSSYVLSTFEDENLISEPYRSDFAKACNIGLVRTSDSFSLAPQQNITELQALVLFARALKYNPEELPSVEAPQKVNVKKLPDWAKDEITFLAEKGLLSEDFDEKQSAKQPMAKDDFLALSTVTDMHFNTVAPGESFYGYINNKAFRNAVLQNASYVDARRGAVVQSEDEWSYLTDINNTITEREKDLLTKLMDGEIKYEKGSAEQRIHDMLISMVDAKTPSAEEVVLLDGYRRQIMDAVDIEALLKLTQSIQQETGIATLLSYQPMLNPDTSRYDPSVNFVYAQAGCLLQFSSRCREVFQSDYYGMISQYLNAIGMPFSQEDLQRTVEIQSVSGLGLEEALYLTFQQGFMLRSLFDSKYTPEQRAVDLANLLSEHPELDPQTHALIAPSEAAFTSQKVRQEVPAVDLNKALDEMGFSGYGHLMFKSTKIMPELNRILSTPEYLTALKINALINLGIVSQYTTSEEEEMALTTLSYSGVAACMCLPINDGNPDPTAAQEEEPAETEEDVTVEGEEKADSTQEPQEEMTPEEPQEEMTPEEYYKSLGMEITKGYLAEENLSKLRELLPNDIGVFYCTNYYDDQTTAAIAKMVEDIKLAYIKRFSDNTWMETQTKLKAIEKVQNIVVSIGYPKNAPAPEIVSVEDGATFFTNLCSINRFTLQNSVKQCQDPSLARTIWLMPPDTVNAFYNPEANSINILAGILAWPVFDINRSYAANLGGIGAIVAHEIGHAFDANGANYDAYGNKSDWWTKQDKEKFMEIQEQFVTYFNRFEVVQGVVQDSKITMTENMADVAGIYCIFDIIGDDAVAQREAMENMATIWAQMGTEKAISSTGRLMDEHSANQVRVNGCIALMDCFYELYDVKEGDPMYIAPEERLKLW